MGPFCAAYTFCTWQSWPYENVWVMLLVLPTENDQFLLPQNILAECHSAQSHLKHLLICGTVSKCTIVSEYSKWMSCLEQECSCVHSDKDLQLGPITTRLRQKLDIIGAGCCLKWGICNIQLNYLTEKVIKWQKGSVKLLANAVASHFNQHWIWLLLLALLLALITFSLHSLLHK